MADAKKCDRCGAYYDTNKGAKSINGYFVRGVRICTSISNSTIKVDLCDDCINKLYDFLYGSIKNKED